MPSRDGRGVRSALTLVLAAAVVAAGCGGSDSDEEAERGSGKVVVNTYGGVFADAIRRAMADPFERETGIKVEVLETADPAASELAVKSGNKPPEDVMPLAFADAMTLNEKGLLAKIEYDSDTRDELPKEMTLDYSLGYAAFAFGLCYDTRKFPEGKPQPSTWADFFNTDKFPGDRGWLTWTLDPTPEIPLLADGVAKDELYPLDLKRAFAKMDELKPSIPKFSEVTADLQQQLVDGSVSMEVCFTHRVQELIDSGVDYVAISYDQPILVVDRFSVWKDAPNRENAIRFLNYMVEPEVQANFSAIVSAGPLNPEAFEFMSKESAARLPTSPENAKNAVYRDDEYYAETVDGKTRFKAVQDEFEQWLRE